MNEFSHVEPDEDPSDSVPGLPCFDLDQPNQQEGQPAERNMASDAFILSVVDGPQLKCRLQRPESPFHLKKLFIPESDFLRGQRIIAG